MNPESIILNWASTVLLKPDITDESEPLTFELSDLNIKVFEAFVPSNKLFIPNPINELIELALIWFDLPPIFY